MNRDAMIKQIHSSWDVLIIGGGATGLGAAVDAASRGYKTLLLEQSDFAKGSSSRSTKLIHGGLRYLKQGNLSLVREGLRERGLLCQNAPHLVKHLPFLIPHSHSWEQPYYRVGMKIYDLLAGKLGIEKSKHLSRSEALETIPTLQDHNLCGATVYYDGQFDDARFAIALAQTAVNHGAVLINYMPMLSFIKEKGKITGVLAQDWESKEEFEIFAKCVINATGVFSDTIRSKDDPQTPPIMAPSQGVHLVLPKKFMPTETALLIPKTKDGRLLFCIPWLNHLLIGTTDTPVQSIDLEPTPQEEEIDFLLNHADHYLTSAPKRKDVLSVFTGLRPLIRKGGKSGSKLSRNHEILTSKSGLITIAGGKWTTYRKMGEEVVDRAIVVGNLKALPCKTEHLRIDERPQEIGDEVVWAVRHEMARTVEDVLARRTRALFLDARTSLEAAPRVAHRMAQELNKDKKWESEQTQKFQKVAEKSFCKV